ncbi:MAG: restriction endonuclease [Calditrichaeota bacterium]|nr:restriction endonuclease [Calditrichota bacterium]
MTKREYESEIKSIIKTYSDLVSTLDKKAHKTAGRAYGGVLRAEKGGLVESIGKRLVEIAWKSLGADVNKLSFPTKKEKVHIQQDYIDRLPASEAKRYIEDHKDKYYILHGSDIHVAIDSNLCLAIECKTFTENAMLKRILVDCSLLKSIYSNLKFVLLQLESQLGGDYSELKGVTFGSKSTHTLLSYFDVDISIITLLKGERKVDRPIHKREFYKPLEFEDINNAVEVIKEILKEF